MQRFERIIGLLLLLRTEQKTSAATLARRFEVSTRTIHRDIEMLSALGVPVYAQRGRGGGIRLLSGYFLPPVMLTTGEATSIILGLTALGSLRSRPFDGDIELARRKIVAALPDHLRALMENVERAVGFESWPVDTFHPEQPDRRGDDVPGSPADAESKAVTAFLQALFGRQRVRMRYESPYRRHPADLLADPAAVFWDRDRWYLVGWQLVDDTGRRIWRADRVTRISASGQASSRGELDVRDLLDRDWLRPAMRHWAAEAPVILEITSRQRDLLMRDWYYRHAIYDDQPDGRVRMTWGEDDPEAAFALLRWLGPGAELIEPVAWRDRLRQDLLRMADAYRE